MVHPGEFDLNSLDGVFDVLSDWEHQLKHANIDFEEFGL